MSIWALSDPHLSFGSDKPMDVFGNHWADHSSLIKQHWEERVQPEDTVVLPGDLSWGINFEQAAPDLAWLDALPGDKLLGRGNHDYWWSSVSKMERWCEANGWASLHFMRHDVTVREGVLIGNTRGWLLPEDKGFSEQDEKIYRRELIRLNLSLDAAARVRQPGQKLLMTLHYPPLGPAGQPTEVTEQLEAGGVNAVVYGHVHGLAAGRAFSGRLNAIDYFNVSCDALGFKPLLLEPWDWPASGR